MKRLRIIAIGKIKASWCREACEYYVKLISRWLKIERTDLKDADSNLSPQARVEEEGERILAHINSGEYVIALTEKGEGLASPAFAKLLERLDEEAKKPVFIIGGPFGLSESLIKKSDKTLSLSEMTFPHELVKVLLLEQIYRAGCIRRSIPYHH